MENVRDKKKKENKKKHTQKNMQRRRTNHGKTNRSSVLPGQNNKKDTVLRMFYKNVENFAEIFNKAVFLKDKIRAEDLQEMDSVETGIVKYRGRKIALHQERDVIKKYYHDKELMLFAIENSTYIDYAILLKVLSYCCLNYNRQMMNIRDERKKSVENNNDKGEDGQSDNDIGNCTDGLVNKNKTENSHSNNSIDSQSDRFTDNYFNNLKDNDFKNGEDSGRNVDLEYKETTSEYLSRFRKNDKITGIVTLLIYYGDEEWDGPLSIHDMMDLSDEEKELVSDYKILHFIDVMRLTPKQLEKFEGQVKILLGFLRYRNDGEALQKFIMENEKLLNTVTSLTEETVSNMCNIEIESLYKEILDIQNEEEIRKDIEEKYREEGELHMNEAFKQIFVKAQNEARKDGYDEGKSENKREIINNMKKEGLSIDKIAIYTGLSVSEVSKYMK